MTTFNKNAEMANGMFDAAQLKNETINVENGTITFYHRVYTEHGTEWLSFKADNDLAFREVVKIMHHNLSMGVDLVVDGVFFGYFKWSNNFADRYVGWKLFTEDGTKVAIHDCGMKRYCENAVNIIAASMYEYIKENYIDPVDAAVAAWGEKYPERYNTIKYNTEDGYFNVWVGEFLSFFPFQMDDKLTGDWDADYKNVSDYLENTLVRELEKYMYVEYDETWVNAIEDTENLLTLSDAWDLGFTVETFLGEWAKTDLRRILYDNSREILSVKMDGKRAKYDYPADNFRRDVRHFIDENVEKTLKNPGRYTSIIANYLYDAWNDDFGIFFDHYDEHEGAIYDDEYREPVENNIATA